MMGMRINNQIIQSRYMVLCSSCKQLTTELQAENEGSSVLIEILFLIKRFVLTWNGSLISLQLSTLIVCGKDCHKVMFDHPHGKLQIYGKKNEQDLFLTRKLQLKRLA
jgi:hypothetical protein